MAYLIDFDRGKGYKGRKDCRTKRGGGKDDISMEEKSNFAKFIRRKREENNLTQKEMAAQLFVTESAVSKWERGVSYPDISLVSQICAVLHISEHELITASEDLDQKRMEKQARSWVRMVKGYSVSMLVIYAVSLVTCLIVNLAVEHRLSWFFLVLGGELVAFTLLSLPLYLQKYKLAVTTGSFWASLTLLLLICAIYTKGDWFFVAFWSVTFGLVLVFVPMILPGLPLPDGLYRQKALFCLGIDSVLLFPLLSSALRAGGAPGSFLTVACPIAVTALVYPWGLLAILRYLKIHPWFRTAAALAFSGIYMLLINSMIDMIIERKAFQLRPYNLMIWDETYISGNFTVFTFMICMLLAVAFAIGGIALTVKKRNEERQ